MHLIEMKCDQCGAQLEIDLDHLQAYCPYCGKKLSMDLDRFSKLLLEKEKTQREKLEHAYKLEDKRITFEHEQRKSSSLNKLAAASMIFFFLSTIISFGWLISIRHRENRQHEENIAVLIALESEIKDDILNEDYDNAMLKAKQLVLNDNISISDQETWDRKRETYIELIQQKIEYRIRNDPDMIFLPFSSSSLNGKPYPSVAEQFASLGFENVTLQITDKASGLFTVSNSVEHVSIGGITTFSEDDCFAKNTPIYIYYYQK